jgi:cell division protease FtsH
VIPSDDKTSPDIETPDRELADSADKPSDGHKEGEPSRFSWSWPSRSRAFWIFLILVMVFAAKLYDSMPTDSQEVRYPQYQDYLKNGAIESGKVVGMEVFHGTLIDGTEFWVNLGPIDTATKQQWIDAGIEFSFEDKPFPWYNALFNFLPWLLFIGLWIFILRQMQGGPKGLFSFGKSRAKVLTEDKRKTTFRDVAGVDEPKAELEEIIEFLKDPKKFQRLGGRAPKGVLMVGHPGTGKTHLARAVAGEAEVPFFSISGSDFVEMFVGVGASRVRDLFEQGKTSAPCIIFIDEIDAVGRHRGAGIGGGHDEREQTLNQLLVEMDGFESNDGVILIAATNRPDVLDPALLRPGRFDRRVVIPLPDVRGREGILKVHSRHVPLSDDVDFKRLARATPGVSGADLENMVNEAALLASRRDRDAVFMGDFEEAKDKVMLGAERRSMVMTEKEKKLTAYHEAGHALIAKLVPGAPPINKATIIPRGQALGMVSWLEEETHTSTLTECKARLTTGLAGRCSELLVFGELTSGATSDYKQITALARAMVCDWGMSDNLGPLSLGSDDDEVFLGKEFTRTRSFSEHTAQLVDAEIRKFVLEAEQSASALLGKNRDKLSAVAEALLEHEVLDNADLDKIMAGEAVVRNAGSAPDNGPDTQSGPPEPEL